MWAKVHRLMRKNVGKPTLLEEMQKGILWLTGLRQTKHHLQSMAVLMEFIKGELATNNLVLLASLACR